MAQIEDSIQMGDKVGDVLSYIHPSFTVLDILYDVAMEDYEKTRDDTFAGLSEYALNALGKQGRELLWITKIIAGEQTVEGLFEFEKSENQNIQIWIRTGNAVIEPYGRIHSWDYRYEFDIDGNIVRSYPPEEYDSSKRARTNSRSSDYIYKPDFSLKIDGFQMNVDFPI